MKIGTNLDSTGMEGSFVPPSGCSEVLAGGTMIAEALAHSPHPTISIQVGSDQSHSFFWMVR